VGFFMQDYLEPGEKIAGLLIFFLAFLISSHHL